MPHDHSIHAADHNCAVCLETMGVESHKELDNSNEYGVTPDGHHVRLSCGHAYCKECTNNLLRNGSSYCPTCRKEISEREIKRLNQQMDTNHHFRGAECLRPEPQRPERSRPGVAATADQVIDRENEMLWTCDLDHQNRERRGANAPGTVPLFSLHSGNRFNHSYQTLLDEFLNQLLFAGLGSSSGTYSPNPVSQSSPTNSSSANSSSANSSSANSSATNTPVQYNYGYGVDDQGNQLLSEDAPQTTEDLFEYIPPDSDFWEPVPVEQSQTDNQWFDDDYALYTIPLYQDYDGYFSTGSLYQPQTGYNRDIWQTGSIWDNHYAPQPYVPQSYGLFSQQPSYYPDYINPFHNMMPFGILGLAF